MTSSFRSNVIDLYIHKRLERVFYFSKNIELLLLKSGSAEIEVSGERFYLSAGSGIALNSRQFFRFTSLSRDHEFQSIVIDIESKTFTGCDIGDFFSASCRLMEIEGRHSLLSIIDRVLKSGKRQNLPYLLLSLIYNSGSHSPGNKTAQMVDSNNKIFNFIEYVDNGFYRKITAAEAADYLCVVPNYLSRYFLRNIGLSFSKYLQEIRLQKSLVSLSRYGRYTEDIAINNGFSGSHYFQKIFKERFGVSPDEWIRKYY